MGNADVVIKNGLVYSGTNDPPVKTDIVIKAGYILKIGEDIQAGKIDLIDAGNLAVAPGFIDIHTHCDENILESGNNSLKNFITQGITTVVTGNCGMGTFEVGKLYSKLDSIGTGANIIHLAGHNVIRERVMGMKCRPPDKYELEMMKKIVSVAMQDGAAGISTGLFYAPGSYSSTDEIVELAWVVKEYGGFYASHIRDESDFTVGLEEAVKEAVYIGEQTGVRVEISHIKALGKSVWDKSPEICRLIENARGRGVYIFADQYPYGASSTVLSSAIVPGWAIEGGKLMHRLKDPGLIPGIQKGITENIVRRGGTESIVIASCPGDHKFDGKNLQEISTILNIPIIDTVVSLILNGDPYIISYNMKESDIINFMKKDYVMTGSDGYIEFPGEGVPHPRCYGTFPHKIRKYVIEDQIISMEDAIRAATSLPAEMTGLKGRGYIKEGYAADIVIFDPDTIRDNATYSDPHQYSNGIEYLLVNGEIVIEEGIYNGKLAGRSLR